MPGAWSGISRKVLTERLGHLVEHGMLERRPYSQRPPRDEYVLTDKGLAFCDVLLAVAAWGDRWADDGSGPPVLFRHVTCGHPPHPEPHCAKCGDVLHADDVRVEPGPGARTA